MCWHWWLAYWVESEHNILTMPTNTVFDIQKASSMIAMEGCMVPQKVAIWTARGINMTLWLYTICNWVTMIVHNMQLSQAMVRMWRAPKTKGIALGVVRGLKPMSFLWLFSLEYGLHGGPQTKKSWTRFWLSLNWKKGNWKVSILMTLLTMWPYDSCDIWEPLAPCPHYQQECNNARAEGRCHPLFHKSSLQRYGQLSLWQDAWQFCQI